MVWRPVIATLPPEHPAHAEVERVVQAVEWTQSSLARRESVLGRIRGLIHARVPSVRVLLFGSTELRTYLPDGDIDLTLWRTAPGAAGAGEDVGDEWALLRILRDEVLADSQPELVAAEVKLLKCEVDGLQVDITIDQVGGLSALGFLTQVSDTVGRGNLFKRTLILLKAWAYYEARVLGAPAGLLGSYALTIMLVAVFVRMSGPATPLGALMRFFEIYSAFDFESYAVSVLGAVPICSDPAVPHRATAAVAAALSVAALGGWEAGEANGHESEFGLTIDFFLRCRRRYSRGAVTRRLQRHSAASPHSAGAGEPLQDHSAVCEAFNAAAIGSGSEGDSDQSDCVPGRRPAGSPATLDPERFQARSLNIVDPLSGSNLGRSVTKSSALRIQAAIRQSLVELSYLCQARRGADTPDSGADRSADHEHWLPLWLARRSDGACSASDVVYGTSGPRLGPHPHCPESSVVSFFRRTMDLAGAESRPRALPDPRALRAYMVPRGPHYGIVTGQPVGPGRDVAPVLAAPVAGAIAAAAAARAGALQGTALPPEAWPPAEPWPPAAIPIAHRAPLPGPSYQRHWRPPPAQAAVHAQHQGPPPGPCWPAWGAPGHPASMMPPRPGLPAPPAHPAHLAAMAAHDAAGRPCGSGATTQPPSLQAWAGRMQAMQRHVLGGQPVPSSDTVSYSPQSSCSGRGDAPAATASSNSTPPPPVESEAPAVQGLPVAASVAHPGVPSSAAPPQQQSQPKKGGRSKGQKKAQRQAAAALQAAAETSPAAPPAPVLLRRGETPSSLRESLAAAAAAAATAVCLDGAAATEAAAPSAPLGKRNGGKPSAAPPVPPQRPVPSPPPAPPAPAGPTPPQRHASTPPNPPPAPAAASSPQSWPQGPPAADAPGAGQRPDLSNKTEFPPLQGEAVPPPPPPRTDQRPSASAWSHTAVKGGRLDFMAAAKRAPVTEGIDRRKPDSASPPTAAD
eukprot:TRINITY_DN7155_c0_g1_i1.p1 TRINITY_DN7155_c0_g1~~TRINITY_DN7155_c0_g1_i1.p1  ORF type:complete len:1000 (+),score=215.87 TRINITY_DN7155_c0_g1_i1:104-3001(+)